MSQGRKTIKCVKCGKSQKTHSTNRQHCHGCLPKCREKHYFHEVSKKKEDTIEQ